MKKLSLLLLLCVGVLLTACENEAYLQEISLYQRELNLEFADPLHSPLTEEGRQHFVKLPFFPVREKYRVEASLLRTPGTLPFEMETTTERRPAYRKYGEAHFELEGKPLKLVIYQNLDLIKKPGFEKHLFLPFGDLTNGLTSYGGGRFLDLEIPEGNELIIDFNKAYNPYCAYNPEYSCPIPPPENRLEVSIEAGVMAPEEHH